MHTIFEVANWFLSNVEKVTNKKLQKLCYYAYSWHLVFFNESVSELNVKLFQNRFEAWIHGAVCPELYEKYKEYGAKEIPPYQGELADFSCDEMDVLEQVVQVYGHLSGNDLETICHKESPWKNARGDLAPYEPSHALISDEDIFVCYAERL